MDKWFILFADTWFSSGVGTKSSAAISKPMKYPYKYNIEIPLMNKVCTFENESNVNTKVVHCNKYS